MRIARRTLLRGTTGLLGTAGLLSASRHAAAHPHAGEMAPGFSGLTSDGATLTLAALRGKTVVLEWTNDGCPFVRKWYNAGAMQALQNEAAGLGVVWISVISSPPGAQGHVDGPRANHLSRDRGAFPAHVVLDSSGTIGKLYGAAVTPTIFIVKPDGVLAYAGGADSIASVRTEDLAKAEPYARDALRALAAGQPVAKPETRAYGCVIHYRS